MANYGRNKRKYPLNHPFESRKEESSFTKITHDMMKSNVWKSLNLRQRGLYLEFKSKYTQKVISGNLESSNKDNISLPEAEWKQLYGDFRTFSADLKVLIDRGFIRVIHRGGNTRTPNIYGFSADWHNWKPTQTEKEESDLE